MIVGLLLLAVLLGVGSLFGYTVLQPVALADRGLRFHARFFVCDFFTLTFLIAVPTSLVTSFTRWPVDVFVLRVTGVLLVGVALYSWARGATALTAIGVVDARKRCVFLGMLLPIAILGSAIAVPTLIISVFWLPRLSAWGILIWLVAIPAIVMIARLCRKCTMWVISDPICRDPDR
ncbi:hypothetical protein Poly41_70190 [Novipirellula artificiosorum]|uniref:Uncharacterized protein n=1 Tax=Novipirellula artificiosorum TaxID=2528016 RepID=A0A5C6CVT9_9BACT|nr:hypothetical protein Poly41_70190 [Novipirellula artificiosorum]